MNIHAVKGHKVKYIGTDDHQVNLGGCDDPRHKLIVGEIYSVDHTEIHSWHTRVCLEGHEGKFNSVSFEDA